jgi:hypothetical protein
MTTTTKHRAGGSIGGNKYGTYQVRYASERQLHFIKKLLEQKQHNFPSDFDLATLNVQGAGDLINELLNCSDKAGFVIPPTEKQLNFAKSLVLNKEGGQELLANVLQAKGVNDIAQLSKQDVSGIINSLKSVKEAPLKITEVGAYLLDETIYSIRQNNDSKKWSVWTYSPEFNKYVRRDDLLPILKKLEPKDRLTLELAIKYSAQVGICVHCGRTLTLLKSVAGGMGAWCAKKYH